MPFAVTIPEAAVTVTAYAPAVVPGVDVDTHPLVQPPLPPPQADTPPASAASEKTRPSVASQLRRFDRIPKSSTKARAALPAAYRRIPFGWGRARALFVGAVVVTVSVAVTADAPLIITGVVDPKLSVGGYCAPLGLPVTEAESETLPVKPPFGVIVMVDVLPVTAPGATVTAVPESERPGVTVVEAGIRIALTE